MLLSRCPSRCKGRTARNHSAVVSQFAALPSPLTFSQGMLRRDFNLSIQPTVQMNSSSLTVWQVLRPSPWEEDHWLAHSHLFIVWTSSAALYQVHFVQAFVIPYFVIRSVQKHWQFCLCFFQVVWTMELTRPNSRHTSALFSPLSISLITLSFSCILKIFLLLVTVAMFSLYLTACYWCYVFQIVPSKGRKRDGQDIAPQRESAVKIATGAGLHTWKGRGFVGWWLCELVFLAELSKWPVSWKP
jgi:hypothetical protein